MPARNTNYEVVRELVAPGAHILITHRHEFDYVFSVSVVEQIELTHCRDSLAFVQLSSARGEEWCT